MNRKVKKIISYIPLLFFGLAILLILQLGYSLANNEVPGIFNRSFLHIKTDSMEDAIMTSDIIIIDQNYDSLSVDDVISFRTTVQNQTVIITHRIVSIDEINNTYTTMGDNNTSVAEWEIDIEEEQIIGKYTGTKLTFLGQVYDRLFSNRMNMIFIIIILIFVTIAVFEIINITKIIQEKKQLETKDEMIKEAKEKLRKEKDDS
ncbi:MAG: signal peptidase I [Tenericutes bacterium]|jgi:signal peptidase|nr:signal peptidase I [Mycoplasmatota bacterium]